MRVTNAMMINNLMRNLSKNLGRMEKTQRSLSSGKRFVNPSDDPIGVSRSLRLNTEVATMNQYKRNADDVLSWLGTTEMAASNINEVLKRAKELVVQAASETNSINERLSIAEEIKELRNQLIHIANTTYAGSYLFSGFKTDKPLLTEDGRYDLGGGTSKLTFDEIIQINIGVGDRIGENFVGQRLFGYYDDAAAVEADLNLSVADSLANRQSMKGKHLEASATNPINGPISFEMTHNSTTITINLAGSYDSLGDLEAAITAQLGAFGGDVTVAVVDNKLVFESNTGDFFIGATATNIDRIGLSEGQKSGSRVETGDKSQLIAIFDKLIDDLEADNTEGISSALTRIENQFENVNAIIAEIGVKMNRVNLTSNRILDDTLNLRDLLSKNEDADIAEVIMNLKMEEYVYQASLSGGAKIIQPSLVDFLT
ncbi:MAG: flagellar hook-associated protein FlgL [Lutisporaceae bacterium]|jgi:flagellar hook-associated protein 3 FlgL